MMSSTVDDISSSLGFTEGTTAKALRKGAQAQLQKQKKLIAGQNNRAKAEIRARFKRLKSGKLGALGFGESGELGVTLGG